MDDHGIYFKKTKKNNLTKKNPMIIHFRVDTHLFIDHLPLRQNAFSSPRLGQKKHAPSENHSSTIIRLRKKNHPMGYTTQFLRPGRGWLSGKLSQLGIEWFFMCFSLVIRPILMVI